MTVMVESPQVSGLATSGEFTMMVMVKSPHVSEGGTRGESCRRYSPGLVAASRTASATRTTAAKRSAASSGTRARTVLRPDS